MQINNYDYIADLYDIYVPVTFDVDFFLQETQKVSGEVLELMAGSGRVSLPLIEAGVKLTCVDLSTGLNQILKEKLQKKGLIADVYTMDVCELDLQKQFEMVIIPFHSFAHLITREEQQKALTRIYEHLLPGGTFICTLGNPALRQADGDGQLELFRKYDLPDDGTLLLWILQKSNHEDEQVVENMQFYEEYDKNGIMTSKRLLELHFRLSTREEFEILAMEAGFKIKAFYGDYEYSPFKEESPFMIWVLEK